MESQSISAKIGKVTNENYFSWKIRVKHVLALNDMEDHMESEEPTNQANAATCKKKGKKAQAIIRLSLSEELLESVREVEGCKQMWDTIKNIF